MTHRHLRAAVMCAALITAPALAQTQPAPTAPASPAPAVATPAPSSMSSGAATEQKAGQWLASKMPGVDVYNASDEKIGDIADLVIDRDGRIHAAIISVGGFLGMGKHDVAVPLAEIKWVETAPSTPRAATPANPMSTPPRSEPTTTGTVNAPAASAAETPRSYPYRAVINMTVDQLKAAPAFKYAN